LPEFAAASRSSSGGGGTDAVKLLFYSRGATTERSRDHALNLSTLFAVLFMSEVEPTC